MYLMAVLLIPGTGLTLPHKRSVEPRRPLSLGRADYLLGGLGSVAEIWGNILEVAFGDEVVVVGHFIPVVDDIAARGSVQDHVVVLWHATCFSRRIVPPGLYTNGKILPQRLNDLRGSSN